MALDLDKMHQIGLEHEKEYSGKGDQATLTNEDERILDNAWEELAAEKNVERVTKDKFVIPE